MMTPGGDDQATIIELPLESLLQLVSPVAQLQREKQHSLVWFSASGKLGLEKAQMVRSAEAHVEVDDELLSILIGHDTGAQGPIITLLMHLSGQFISSARVLVP
jgi:hypothetical protein